MSALTIPYTSKKDFLPMFGDDAQRDMKKDVSKVTFVEGGRLLLFSHLVTPAFRTLAPDWRVLPTSGVTVTPSGVMATGCWSHRHHADGSHDSTCTVCLATAATVQSELELTSHESAHVL
jgi:hypothetical protein